MLHLSTRQNCTLSPEIVVLTHLLGQNIVFIFGWLHDETRPHPRDDPSQYLSTDTVQRNMLTAAVVEKPVRRSRNPHTRHWSFWHRL